MSPKNWFSNKHHSHKQPRDERGRFIKKPTLLELFYKGLGSIIIFLIGVVILFWLYIFLFGSLLIMITIEFTMHALGFSKFHISWIDGFLDCLGVSGSSDDSSENVS